MAGAGVATGNGIGRFIDEILEKCSHEHALQSFIAGLFPVGVGGAPEWLNV